MAGLLSDADSDLRVSLQLWLVSRAVNGVRNNMPSCSTRWMIRMCGRLATHLPGWRYFVGTP